MFQQQQPGDVFFVIGVHIFQPVLSHTTHRLSCCHVPHFIVTLRLIYVVFIAAVFANVYSSNKSAMSNGKKDEHKIWRIIPNIFPLVLLIVFSDSLLTYMYLIFLQV